MSIGERLYEHRKKHGYSQEEIADKLEVSRQTVSKWENNMTTPELSKAVELCKIYGTTVESLMRETDELKENFYNSNKLDGENNNQDMSNNSEANSKCSKTIVHEHRYLKGSCQYTSKAKIGKIPLIHVNIGIFPDKKKGNGIAKGIIAIGNVSVGVISIGFLPIGLISIGLLALGILGAIGTVAVGLYSFGAVAFGMMSFGAISIGYMSVGAVAIGNYSIGAAAIANEIAVGAYASGMIAFGEEAVGTHVYIYDVNSGAEVLQAIKFNLPYIPNWIYKIFHMVLI